MAYTTAKMVIESREFRGAVLTLGAKGHDCVYIGRHIRYQEGGPEVLPARRTSDRGGWLGGFASLALVRICMYLPSVPTQIPPSVE